MTKINLLICGILLFAMLLSSPVLGAVDIGINSPINGQVFYGETAPTVSFTVYYTNTSAITSCIYSTSGGIVNYTIPSCASGTIGTIFGINTLNVWIKDVLNATDSDYVSFNVVEADQATTIPSENVTDLPSALDVANRHTGGWFWGVMVFMVVVVMMITLTPFGWEVSMLSSLFTGIVLTLILLYADLVSYKVLGMFVGAILLLFLYIIWSSNRDQ